MKNKEKKNKKEDATTTQETPVNEQSFESLLRPKTLEEFVGQDKLKSNLKIFIQAAKKRNEALDHSMFYAPPGLGKTTLAHILAREMGSNIRVTSGPILARLGDLASLLTSLEERDVLFIDEIHRLNRIVEEALYPVMEDFTFYIHTGKVPGMGSQLKLAIPKFTLVAATTRVGLLTGPLRDRFGIIGHLDFYEHEDIEKIVARNAKILNIEMTPEAIRILSKRARRTPRVANRLLHRIRDFAQVLSDGQVTDDVVMDSLKRLEVDNEGLEPMDRKFLSIIIEHFNGGPVGIETISASLQEDPDTITDIYESYLIQSGFLARTSKGRVATQKAYEHLGYKINSKNRAKPADKDTPLFS
ncbi:Holliday junction branch migration DNA helicase RuvB [Elusimicrobiota bacterium]